MPFYASWEEAVPNQSALKSHAFVTSSYRAQEEQNKGDVLALPISDQDAVDTLLDTLGAVAANIEAVVSSRVDDSLINEIRRRPLGAPPGAPGPAARVAFPVPARRPLDPEGPDLPPAAPGPRAPGEAFYLREPGGRDWFGRPFPEAKEGDDYGSEPASDIRAGSRDDLSAFSRFSGSTVPREGSLRAISEGTRTRDAFPPSAALAPRTRAKIDEFDVDPDEIQRRSEVTFNREDADRLRKLQARKLEALARAEEETTFEPFAPEDVDPRIAYLGSIGRSPRRPATPRETSSTESESPSPVPTPTRRAETSPFLSGTKAAAAPVPRFEDYVQHFQGLNAAAVSREGTKLNKGGFRIEIPTARERTGENLLRLLQEVATASQEADRIYFEANNEVRPGSAFAPKEFVEKRRVVKGKAPDVRLARQVTLEKEGSGMSGGAQASALPTSAKVGTLIDRALRMLKKMDFRVIPGTDLTEIKNVTDHIRSMVIVPGGDPALATIQDKVMALLTQLDVKLATNKSFFQVKEGSGFGYMPAARTSEYIGPVMEAMPRRYM